MAAVVETSHPVEREHEQFKAMRPKWDRVADCVSGGDAVKAKGVLYLPRLKAEGSADYEARKMRADFFNATGRTVDALLGLVFRKPPTIDLPDSIAYLEKNATGSGITLADFAKQLVRHLLAPGRCGILVDAAPPEQNRQVMPTLQLYTGTRIDNWRENRTAGSRVLTQVKLAEDETEDDPSGFGERTVPQYRVVQLGRESGGCEQQIWQKRQGEGSLEARWVAGETIGVLRRAEPLPFLPFRFVNPMSCEPDVEDPPLLDLADTNLSLYRTSADLEHLRHFTGMPTPWGAGFDKAGNFYIGSTKIALTTDPNAKMEYLALTGSEAAPLENAVKEKTGQMIVLGARLLEPRPSGVEAAETLRLRQGGESSIMATVVSTATQAIEWALQVALWWASGVGDLESFAGKATCKLNTDFVDARLDATEAMEWLRVKQGRGISNATLMRIYRQGEVPLAETDELELAEIETEAAEDRMDLDEPAEGAAA